MIYNVNFKGVPQLASVQRLTSVPRQTGFTKLELEQWTYKVKKLKDMVVEDLEPEIKRMPVLVGGKSSGMNIAQMSEVFIESMQRQLAVLRANPNDLNAIFSLTRTFDHVMKLFQK